MFVASVRERPAVHVYLQHRSALVRAGLDALVAAQPDLVAVAIQRTVDLDALAELRPDVAVVELDGTDHVPDLVRELRRRQRALRVVCTFAAEGAGQVRLAHQAGAHAFVPDDAGAGALLAAIRSRSLTKVSDLPRPVPSRPRLTPRELQVLGLIAEGHVARQAAAALGISPKSFDCHKQRIFHKLGVQNQAHAVAVAIRLRLLAMHA